MLKRIRHWFRLEKSERSWLLMLSGGIFFLTGANFFLWTVLQTTLVKHAGVEFLPYFYTVSSFALLIGGWVSLRWLRRIRPLAQSGWFVFVSFFGTLLLAIGHRFFSAAPGPVPVLVFVAFGLLINSATLVGALEKLSLLAAEVFTIGQLQRLQPILDSVAAVSAFGAGLFLSVFANRMDSTMLFVLAAIAMIVTAPLYAALRNKMKKRPPSASFLEAERHDGSGQRRWSLGTYVQNLRLRRFLYTLGFIVGLSMIFTRIFSFQFMVAANAQYVTEGALNAFIGKYTALLSLGSLIFINSVQRVLFKRYGMTMNLLTPTFVVMAGAIATVAVPAFPVVVLSFYIRDVTTLLQQTAGRIVLGGMSDYQRNQAWTWLNGPVTTLGGLAGSIIVAGLSSLYLSGDVEYVIRLLGLCVVLFLLVHVFFTLRLRKTFPSVLLDSLQRGDIKTRMRAMEAMAEFRFMKDRHLGTVLDVIRDDTEPIPLRTAAVRTVSAIKDASILRVVGRLLNHWSPDLRIEAIKAVKSFRYLPEDLYVNGFSRFVLIDKLHSLFRREKHSPEMINEILEALIVLQDPAIIPLIASSLRDPLPELRHSALHSLRPFADSAIIDYVKPSLSSANPDIRAQAVAAIWQFPWERESTLEKIIDDLLHAPPGSEAFRQGLYLIGILRLHDRRPIAVKALRSDKRSVRLTAAISLLRLRDESGMTEIEQMLRRGTPAEAHEITRLEFHPNVPLLQRQHVGALVHKFHLHYPADLPVNESLRVRMVDIPKACLKSLVAFYQAPESSEDRQKIEQTLTETKLPPVRGNAVLVRLDSPWRDMASVALLAQGILTRSATTTKNITADDIVIGNAGDPDLPNDAFTLNGETQASGRQIMKLHYAPSELISTIRKFHPEMFPSDRLPKNRLR